VDWEEKFSAALGYDEFLARYAQSAHLARWQAMFERIRLSSQQQELLGSFVRDMNVLCLAGAWCGDCINQCPMFEHFARATAKIQLRFLDRDEHPEVRDELSINAGHRVPVIVFLSEDFSEASRYGERTLAQYRQLARDLLGPACPTGIVAPAQDLLAAITQNWLDEFERVQLILRLSPRLRQKHGD
jgi:thiol-disulfide isomerase/thioredoxin